MVGSRSYFGRFAAKPRAARTESDGAAASERPRGFLRRDLVEPPRRQVFERGMTRSTISSCRHWLIPASGIGFALWVLAASLPVQARAGVSVWIELPRLGTGVSSMSEAHAGSLLVEYFKAFLQDRDLDSFRDRVAVRYNEGTLCRLLAISPDVAARRGCPVAGLAGELRAMQWRTGPGTARRRRRRT